MPPKTTKKTNIFQTPTVSSESPTCLHSSHAVADGHDVLLVLLKNRVDPVHLLPSDLCAVARAVQVSVTLNNSPVSQNRPSVTLTGVSDFAGGAPRTLSGVNSSILGRR